MGQNLLRERRTRQVAPLRPHPLTKPRTGSGNVGLFPVAQRHVLIRAQIARGDHLHHDLALRQRGTGPAAGTEIAPGDAGERGT